MANEQVERTFRALRPLTFDYHPDPELVNQTVPAGWEGVLPNSEAEITLLKTIGAIEEIV